MTMLRILLVSFLSLLANTLLAAPPKNDEAAALEVRTRAFVNEFKGTGLPDAIELARLKPILSADFHRALASARAASDADVKAAPGDKPRFVEFDFISADGSFDGYKTVSLRRLSDRLAKVDVEFFDEYQGQIWRWTDRYRWILENSVWRLDDIEREINDPSRTTSAKPSLDE